jgi:hypothetical protein
MTVYQSDIKKTLAEIAKYPTKNREIIFIEDRIENIPTTGFLTTEGKKRRDSELVGQCGNVGQYTSFMLGASQPSNYTYLQSDSLYALDGEGGLGFLMLDVEGKLKYAANARNFCVPTSVGTDWTMYSYDEGGVLHEIAKAGDGTERVVLQRASTLSSNLSEKAIKAVISGNINGTDIKYLRKLITEGNLAAMDLREAKVVSGGVSYYQTYRTSVNSMGTSAFDGFKKLISVLLPNSLTKIEQTAFRNSGLKMIEIPEAVTTIGMDAFAGCGQLSTVIIGSKVRTMEQGVFYSSAVKEVYVKPLTPPSIADYLFSSKPIIHVYSSALSAYQNSAWANFGTIVGDLEDCEIITTPILAPDEETHYENDSDRAVYNLQGIRVANLKPGTIYMRNGKKFMLKP